MTRFPDVSARQGHLTASKQEGPAVTLWGGGSSPQQGYRVLDKCGRRAYARTVAKLDWERSNREIAVRSGGAERGSVTRFRAVAPADKDVERLQRIGYSGRPATTAELRRLLKEWHPPWVRITGAKIDELRRLPADKRRVAIDRLLTSLEQAYATELRKLEGRRSAKGTKKIVARTTREFECLRRRLQEIA